MILITGGLGFIGSHTTRALLDLGESCVLVGRGATAVPAWLDAAARDRVVVERADIADGTALAAIGERHAVTGIVHLAGGFGADPRQTLDGARAGVTMLLNVLEAASRWQVHRVGVASTIGVYDGGGESPLREDMPLPLTAGHAIPAGKKVDELLAGFLGPANGLAVHCMRIGAVWGPLGRPASRFHAAPQFVHAAVRGHAPDLTTLYRPPYAEDGLDLVYARDCGRAIALLQLAGHLEHRVYNVAAGRSTSNGELAAAIGRLVPGTRIELPSGRDPEGQGRDIYLDIARLRADTGFRPAYDTERAVADYAAWLRAGNER